MPRDEPSRLPVSCAVCVHRWYGIEHAHCTACHHTFGDAALFDRHRVRRQCADPVLLGMTRHQETDVWRPGAINEIHSVEARVPHPLSPPTRRPTGRGR